MKAFHCEILNDHKALKQEQENYQPIPEIRKVDQSIVIRNYMQLKQDVLNLVEFEMERILADPAQQGLVIRK